MNYFLFGFASKKINFMKIKIPSISIDADKLIRRCGYAELRRRTGETSYVRRLRGYQFPRFHIYIENGYFNLHLDQKAPCYQGSSAHAGEYDGEILEKEKERIKETIIKYKE